ncbi:MAG: phosphatidylserine/phosphatidylglycerophosphate/cardiolipin synthase family protein [Myxococcales bacterium]|nr:phosphatidylserine/phosphatidylglycerophosphate/cardiolipin synthase family protein [Myxococcales bacterium]
MASPPTSRERSAGVTARVAEIVRSFFAEQTGELEANEPPPGRGTSALEGAVQAISDSLDRWRSTGGLVRFTQTGGRDRLVAAGVPVELELPVDRLTRLRAAQARVRVGDEVVDEVEIRGPVVRVRAIAREPGIHPVVVDALDRRGHVVAWGQAREAPIVQVITDAPTAAVNAELLLSDPARDLAPLRELALRGWSLVFFDLHPDDRQRQIREALSRHGLPRGAILVHPKSDVEFKTLGIDFHTLFAATRIRRIRADGVPLVLMVTSESEVWATACAADEIASVDLDELAERLRGPGGLDPWVRAAADLRRRFAASPTRRWRLDVLADAPVVSGNRCVVELDNRRARERLFALIERATTSVHLQFYILRPGIFTERLAVRLIRAARAGVAVRLIVDALYSTQGVLGLTNPIADGLGEEPGIEIVASAPISSDRLEVGAFKRRDHRKLIIIDGEVALVGGRNCGDEYYTGFDEVAITDWTPHERVPWLDAHVEVHGPLVSAVQRDFVTTWRASGGPEIADENALFPDLAAVGDVDARLVLHRGLVDTNTLGAYEALVDGADRHVYILNDFPILASLQGGLLRALDRGVRVVILTGSGVARRGDGKMLRGPLARVFFEYMTKHRLEPLIRAGAETYEYATPKLEEIVTRGGVVRPYVHAKVMSVDGEVASVGSANLDVTASYWENEANVVIESAAVVRELEATIERLLATSYRIDLDSSYWRGEARMREITSTLWPETLYS